MRFKSLGQCIAFLEKEGQLHRIDTPVDPYLEMAVITRRVFEAQGPALLFTRIKNTRFPAVSNLFGTWERTLKIFEPQMESVRALVDVKSDLGQYLKSPAKLCKALPALLHALPLKSIKARVLEKQCSILDLPMIQCWPKDGGAFILLPQVFSADPQTPSLFSSNLGMYRVQISGNEYQPGNEIGLHYQIHRGIGNHHKKALAKNLPLPVSIFVGGPPAHTLAAVMPLPEGVPEICFAGALAGRNFRYTRSGSHLLSSDADFCITGFVMPGKTRKEGPFGDHLGYYSLAHDYPYLKVTGVYHRKDAVFPFTVVGRPPQEDTQFGRLIHEITRSAVKEAIPGVSQVHAVDAAGVHPLLLATANERYLPYETVEPRELLTHAMRILGTGQLSLAKYLLIRANEDHPAPNINDESAFFTHVLERIDFSRDIHFITKTTIDTLDYSTQKIHDGSKLIVAAAGPSRRTLAQGFAGGFSLPQGFGNPAFAGPGIVVIEALPFSDYQAAADQAGRLKKCLADYNDRNSIPLVVLVDDAGFSSRTFANFLWVTFTRSNPSHDIYGVNERFECKHWQCDPPMIIDARIKPFHAGVLEPDVLVEAKVTDMGKKGGPLYGII